MSEGRLAGTGRAVENERGELICLNGPTQQPAWSQDVVLPNEVVEDSWAKSGSQRLFLLYLALAALFEQVKRR